MASPLGYLVRSHIKPLVFCPTRICAVWLLLSFGNTPVTAISKQPDATTHPENHQPQTVSRIEALETALEGVPNDLTLRVALARAYAEAGRADDVTVLLEKDRDARDDPEALRLLGSAYFALDQVADARRCYRRVVRLTDATAEDCFTLGRIHLREGNYALAVERLEKSRTMNRDDVELHLALASAYGHLGKHLGSLRVVKVAGGVAGRVAGDEFLIEARSGNDTFLVAPRDSEIYHLRRALDAGVDTLNIREAWALCWLYGQRYGRAVKALETLAPRINTPSTSRARRADYYANLAKARFGADDVEGFLAALQHAVELDTARQSSKLGDAYRRAAERYTQRGDLPRTIHYLERAVAEMPKSADLHYRLGIAYWEAGQRRVAAQQWQMTLQIEGNHPARDWMLEWIQTVRAGGQ